MADKFYMQCHSTLSSLLPIKDSFVPVMTLPLFFCEFDDCVDDLSCYLKENILCEVFNGQLNMFDIKMHFNANPEEAKVALITQMANGFKLNIMQFETLEF